VNGAERWSRDHHEIDNLHTDTRTKKFTDSKNAILFDLRRKITKLSRKKTVSEQWRYQALGRLEFTLVVNIAF